MGATEKTGPEPTFAGATPLDQPTKTHKRGGACRRFAFKHAVSRYVCCSDIELGGKKAEEGGGPRLENAIVFCSNVVYDSDAEDNQYVKGGGSGGGGVAMESVSFCCSSVDLKKKKKIDKIKK